MGFDQIKIAALLCVLLIAAGCSKNASQPDTSLPSALSEVPSVRLNYRYEADVPPPEEKKADAKDRNAAVQNDFDQNRPQEVLDKTLPSPDGKRVLAVYHKVSDMQAEFRLDMYAADGKILRKITADAMAVHFPDTILWSPDSANVAFVGMTRAVQTDPGDNEPNPNTAVGDAPANTLPTVDPNANTNTSSDNTDANSDSNTAATPEAAPTPAAPVGVLTFRSEQIYICNADGDGIKALTQNEGLIYFYYVWAPDSSALAALAVTGQEWKYLQFRADEKGEVFVPVGRPRIVEKTGRERRLDDGLTAVRPIWSPDSAKVAAGFDVQVRIYDAGGNSPTQAAVPLRNNLLLSSQAFDRDQQRKLDTANVQPDASGPANTQPPADQSPTTLPDPNTLVSFNPIVMLNWPTDDQLYFQTAFVKRMKNEMDSAVSFPRWHRLILTPQAVAPVR